jgi:hypothetical protein
MKKQVLIGFYIFLISPLFAQYDLEINNIRARNEANGLLFNNSATYSPGFEAPIDSSMHTFYAFNLWVSGLNNSMIYAYGTKFLQSAGNTFRYGPIMDSEYYETENDLWDRVWNISRSEIEYHINNYNDPGYTMPEVIENWPAHGDISKGQAANLAPFIDVNNNGLYEPELGDYPSILGDQAIYSIYNGERFNEEMTPMGIETHVMTYAFDCDDVLDNVIFLYTKQYNRSDLDYTDAYLGFYADTDIGDYIDDFIMTDVDRASLIATNGDAYDDVYGTMLPAQSITVLRGAKQDADNLDNDFGILDMQTTNGLGYGDGIIDNEYRGLDFSIDVSNGSQAMGDPENEIEFYNTMTGKWRYGENIKFGGNGYDTDTSSINSRFKNSYNDSYQFGTYGQEPFQEYEWWSFPSDKRMIGSSGPFTFDAGTSKDMYLAFVFNRGGQGNQNSLANVRENIDAIKVLFNNDDLECGSLVLSLKENQITGNNKLSVYPNPFIDVANFTYEGNDPNAIIRVYDLVGHLLMQSSVKIGANQVDLSKFDGNAFILQLSDNKAIYSQKLIKR